MSGRDSFVVAIDGPAASGKSTTARLAAQRLGFRYLDTGAMYRAVTWKVLSEGVDPADEEAVAGVARLAHLARTEGPAGDRLLLDGRDVTERIREPSVTGAVSLVARVPAVRREMVRLQREMSQGGPCVVEGRDIGTVVFPEAPVKIFLAASLEERARRRRLELGDAAPSLSDLAQEIRRRDAMDSDREDSPLRQAEDAVVLDTTGLTIDETADEIVRRVRAALEGRGG
jgi:cytidylate kinase